MKTYKYLYSEMLKDEIIRKAYKKLHKGKSKRKEVIYIDEHLDQEIERMKQMIINTKPEGYPVEHPELAFEPTEKRPRVIFEHGKSRTIYMPGIYEQWMHHIIVLVLEPIIVKESYRYTCGSFPKRGAHYGKRAIDRWMRLKSAKYFAKIDIRHFYNSIPLKVLMRELEKKIKDDWFLYILEKCFTGFKKGIPLGFYISQWLANYLLKPLDYMIKQKIMIPSYMRYMDDMVMFSPNKKKLHEAIVEIRKLLGRRFRLKLKDNYQVCRFIYTKKNGKVIGRFLDFMGFVFKRNRTVIRESIMLSSTRLARKIMKRVEKPIFKKQASAIVSYMGWYKCTDTYDCYLTNIKPFVNIKTMKQIISKLDRRENRNGRMERREMPGMAGGIRESCTEYLYSEKEHPGRCTRIEGWNAGVC